LFLFVIRFGNNVVGSSKNKMLCLLLLLKFSVHLMEELIYMNLLKLYLHIVLDKDMKVRRLKTGTNW